MLLKRDLKRGPPIAEVTDAGGVSPVELENVLAFLAKRESVNSPPAAWKSSSDLNVSFSRLKNAASEPQNWLTYWGNYRGTHFSELNSITRANVKSLAAQWTYQFGAGAVESVPLVVDGVMFDRSAEQCGGARCPQRRPIWRYNRTLPNVAAHCTVMTNRGLAILGDRLYGTLDSHLAALDAKTGSVIWDIAVEDYQKGFSITHAPLALDGKIIIGITAGECALTGFVDAMTPPQESCCGGIGRSRRRETRIAPPGPTTRQPIQVARQPG